MLHAAVREGRLEILVWDDGPGADPSTVARATGVRLSVICQRLQLRHGARASLTVDTAPGKGFGVTLSLPAETESLEGRVFGAPSVRTPNARKGESAIPLTSK